MFQHARLVEPLGWMPMTFSETLPKECKTEL